MIRHKHASRIFARFIPFLRFFRLATPFSARFRFIFQPPIDAPAEPDGSASASPCLPRPLFDAELSLCFIADSFSP